MSEQNTSNPNTIATGTKTSQQFLRKRLATIPMFLLTP